MKKLHNLSIRKKFAVVIVPLILTIVCFDFIHIRHDYLDYKDATRLNKAINVGYQITHLLHELQIERSVSIGFMIGEDNFAEKLMAQRNNTDSVLQMFHHELSDAKLDQIRELHDDDLAEFRHYEERLTELRGMVDSKSLAPRQAIRSYAEINNAGLNLINVLITESRDKFATQQLHAIIYFLESKEYASVERSLGTLIFSTGEEDPNINAEFAGLLSAQSSYIDAFLKISDEPSHEFYRNTIQGQDTEELEQMRALFFESKGISVDPTRWHEVITKKINSLKLVEEFLIEEMHTYTVNLAANSWGAFWTFLMIDLLVASSSLYLMAFIISKLIKNVATLETFTRNVGRGDLSHKVEIDTSDEIGHYAKTFNLMVVEIKKTHKKLRKAKDYAEYLYENIYKQSQVVFEHVEQGIFLLDKDFKISSLYSKAVERIFDNDVIANENFCNFMRPRIIQRDFEALEMFMKHLFNPELDEEVVTQLNPIEQVKIFISTNGVVITKYLRVSFTRIARADEIQTIMVSISDETESVLLQQHMEESEVKKKKETEYMLNIFKVDPNVLGDFLQNTRKMLKGISEKYEKGARTELNELLKYTFQVIHTIKGNAMSLGVDLVSEKLHEIEDSITALRDKNVTPDKFLALLFEIEEVDKMTLDMSKVLEKVGEVYKNFQSPQSKNPFTQFEESLKQGLEVMSQEIGKKVGLKISKANDAAFPEEYLNPVKDIVVQMMRNSLSHGIEVAESRLVKGKPAEGTISLSIEGLKGKGFELSYKDDGKGVDLDLVRRRAIAKGFVSAEKGSELTDDEVLNMLFDSGFSTTEKADNFSGRGQGLNIVKSIIQEYGGSFEVLFEKDQYFELRFVLPAILESKMDKVA